MRRPDVLKPPGKRDHVGQTLVCFEQYNTWIRTRQTTSHNTTLFCWLSVYYIDIHILHWHWHTLYRRSSCMHTRPWARTTHHAPPPHISPTPTFFKPWYVLNMKWNVNSKKIEMNFIFWPLIGGYPKPV